MKTQVYAHDDLDCHFTIVPSRIVTDKISVELRASVRSNSTYAKEISIDFYLDEYDAGKLIGRSGPQQIQPGASCLHTVFMKTAGLSGDHQLMAAFHADGMPIAAAYIPLKIVPCDTRALPFIQTAWFEPFSYVAPDGSADHPTEEDARSYLRMLKAVGINGGIIVASEGVAFGHGAFFPSALPEVKGLPSLNFDYVGTILDEAEKLDMDIFVGLGRGDDLWLLWTGLFDEERIDKQLDFGKRLADELWLKYGHYQSYYGWFIAHETDSIANANNYYNRMADILHAYCPDKPVMIAPSPGCVIPDETCEEAAAVVSAAHYDIIAYQDAVGAGTHPFGNTWNQEKRISNLHKYYRRNAKSHAQSQLVKHIWTDLEIWCMDGPTYGDPYAASWPQVTRQIEIERNYVDHISAYAMPSMFQDRNARYVFTGVKDIEKSFKLYEDYKAYYEKARGCYGI